ncbi:hybrid sensor histidine kinase/response regulator [Hirschia maritima]|uniref:hybrid sensor histidine kinase/response regulator n=1 Tax=Hirschia maritima TaxID=1121961 RepID=UPI00036D4C08|nr:hybrid sensor histidine kinase/response regulator [Hirschia maritima]
MLSLAHSTTPKNVALKDAPKVLIVDDELPVLLTLKRALRKQFHIEVAINAMQALDRLADKENFAVIISDMHMPAMDGIEFLKQAQNLSPNTSRIMLSGAHDLDLTLQALNECEVFRFLQKPCSADDIANAIRDGAKAFEQREAPDKAASNLLSKFHKELQIPLSQMVDFAKMIYNDQALKGTPKEFASQIIENGNAVLDTSETILDLVAMQSQKYEPSIENIDVQKLIRHASQPHKKLALAKGMKVNLATPSSPIDISSDERLLRRALSELISNAIKFSKTESEVEINVEISGEDDSHIMFEITDSGCGLDTESVMSNLKDSSYINRNAHSEEIGSGLGLPLALATAETLGGFFEIESLKGSGTKAKIFIPVKSTQDVGKIPL